MTTRYFRWDDSGAPVLSGTAGSLLAIVRACLVGTSGVAYGSGPTAKPAAGWTEPFSGTNKAAFRNSLAAGGSGCYLRVLDDGSLAAGAKEASIRVYGAMTNVDTGADLVPTTAQMANGAVARKSTTANSTARHWIISADERTCWIWLEANGAAEDTLCGGGDYEDFVAGSTYNYFCAGRNTENVSSGANGMSFSRAASLSSPGSNQRGLWLARTYALTGTAVEASVAAFGVSDNGAIGGTSSLPGTPAPGIGGTLYMPAYIVHGVGIRGRLRGLFVPLATHAQLTSASTDASPTGRPGGSVLTRVSAPNAGDFGTFALESAVEF